MRSSVAFYSVICGALTMNIWPVFRVKHFLHMENSHYKLLSSECWKYSGLQCYFPLHFFLTLGDIFLCPIATFSFIQAFNYSLSGVMLPITLHSSVVKGHLVVLVCRDVYFKHRYSWALQWYVLNGRVAIKLSHSLGTVFITSSIQ